MKLQRTTLILLVSAIILGGVVYFSEIQGAQKQEAVKTTKQPIFFFKEDEIQSLKIFIDEETLEFERAKGQPTDWRMTQPKNVLVSNAPMSFLLNLLVQGKRERSFAVQPNQLKEYGLDKPLASIKVELKNQQSHWLILGKPDFNKSFLYAQVNPTPRTPQPLEVVLVPVDFEYAVMRPMSEWEIKQPQPETPKPSPTPGSSKQPPTSKTAKPSPTPKSAQPSPTPKTSKPSPTPGSSKPSPTPKSSQPSPTPGSSKPSPTPKSSQPSPTPKSAQPSPTSNTAKPSPTPESSKPSSTPKSSQPSPTPKSSQPSPTR